MSFSIPKKSLSSLSHIQSSLALCNLDMPFGRFVLNSVTPKITVTFYIQLHNHVSTKIHISTSLTNSHTSDIFNLSDNPPCILMDPIFRELFINASTCMYGIQRVYPYQVQVSNQHMIPTVKQIL